MIFDLSWQELLVGGLACFRLSVLLSSDDGPYRMFTKLRSWLKREAKHSAAMKKTAIDQGIECLRCTSVHMAIPIAAYVLFAGGEPRWFVMAADLFLLAMALSGAAILFNRAFPKR